MADKAKEQHNNILLAVAGFSAVVAIVALIGFLALGRDPEVIQGEMEVEEYRVSGKVPGRILELRVKEGDMVQAGDTLAIIEAPEVEAKMTQAQSAVDAASAIEQMAKNGARREQIQAAAQLVEQAKAGLEIAEKSYNRMKVLFDEEVVSSQKFDEAQAMYKSAQAQLKAAQSQYDMAVNGARAEEKRAASASVGQARGAVQEVTSYIKETVQVAPDYVDCRDGRPVGDVQHPRGPAEGHQGGCGAEGSHSRPRRGDDDEGDVDEGQGLVCRVEGHEGYRPVRPEDVRGEGPSDHCREGRPSGHVGDTGEVNSEQ